MTNDHTKVIVDAIPPCDVCGDPAIADAKTDLGPWGYVCAKHFKAHGCSLGLGRGQELVLRSEQEQHEFEEGWDRA